MPSLKNAGDRDTPEAFMKHDGPIIARRNVETLKDQKVEVMDCQICGYAHLHPLPSLEELGEFYAYHFYEKQKPEYLSKFEKEETYWLAMNSWRFRVMKKHLKTTRPHVLDVGASGGLFLESARREGATVAGIEPSSTAAKYAKEKFNIDLQVDIYENCQFEPASFDVIYSSLVMEHLRDPAHFVRWAFDHLKPGGLFVAETPNEFNVYQNLLVNEKGYEPWFVAYPDHLNYFTIPSLQRLLTGNGFEAVKAMTSFPMEQFVLMGMDYLKDPSWGPKAHQARMNFETSLLETQSDQMLETLYTSWADAGIGRTQLQLFRKR